VNYYPFHIGDFRSGTVNMTRQARWIYRDMLDVYYDSERPLTLDLEKLCDDLGVTDEDEIAIVRRLLKFKFKETPGGYVNDVCDVVIADYRAKADTAKANGKLGGRPKKPKGNPEKPSGFQSGTYPQPSENPIGGGSQTNQEPRTNNQEPGGGAQQKAPPVDNSAPPLISDEFREVLNSRPDLPDPGATWLNFVDHYQPASRTLARWRKWVANEHAPKATAAPEDRAPDPLQDPNSKASIEARGIAQGIGPWDGVTESFVDYRIRVDGTASSISKTAHVPFHMRKGAPTTHSGA
jgi:uncharacterized protein YdaU (DUF1376 family)